jgi:hypothetical protein
MADENNGNKPYWQSPLVDEEEQEWLNSYGVGRPSWLGRKLGFDYRVDWDLAVRRFWTDVAIYGMMFLVFIALIAGLMF